MFTDRAYGACLFLVLVEVVGRLAGGDVVDIRHLLVWRVDIVEAEGTAGHLGRDRSARLVVALLFRFGAAAALRFGVGPEVAAASRHAAGGGIAAAVKGPGTAEGAGWARRKATAWPWTGRIA